MGQVIQFRRNRTLRAFRLQLHFTMRRQCILSDVVLCAHNVCARDPCDSSLHAICLHFNSFPFFFIAGTGWCAMWKHFLFHPLLTLRPLRGRKKIKNSRLGTNPLLTLKLLDIHNMHVQFKNRRNSSRLRLPCRTSCAEERRFTCCRKGKTILDCIVIQL